MNVGLILDLLLIALLLVALVFGLRLERKLKGLRESQAGFVKAVQELDAAAARAEAGLEALNRATQTAQNDLTERLDEAQDLVRRIERASSAGPPPPLAFEPPLVASRPAPARDALFDAPEDLTAALRALRRRRGEA